MNRWVQQILSWALCAALASCATPALWDATNPRRCVAIKKTPANEEALKAKGIPYTEDPKRDYFYVEKSKLRKAGDYASRTLATPVTVILDAAGTAIVVVGVLAILSVHTPEPEWRDEDTRREFGGR